MPIWGGGGYLHPNDGTSKGSPASTLQLLVPVSTVGRYLRALLFVATDKQKHRMSQTVA